MREWKYFNNKFYNSDNSLIDLKKKNSGVSNFYLSVLEKRFELFKEFNFNNYFFYKWLNIFKYLNKRIAGNSNILNITTINIFFLDLISSYRGLRHIQGLPVRGQRTWTNAWSTYRSNLTLRNFKLSYLKKNFSKISIGEIQIAQMAEQFNLLWKLQWENEWKSERKKRLNLLKKSKNPIKIDLNSISQGQINIKKDSRGKNRKKMKTSKNKFNTGFDVGFTNVLLKSSLELNTNNLKRVELAKQLRLKKETLKNLNKKKVNNKNIKKLNKIRTQIIRKSTKLFI
uniref:ribosomal protein S13 n=1 Tax=Cryptocaryon irritans TaxID=153251 RepID=UPI0022FD6F2C|nr:ribosomal protein S13 [Cryptocaryon irritans]WBP62313.1 ribosomal protein S13 [Cryptocaryon irritans]